MLFKHLITEIRWTRSFSLEEMAKISEISKKEIRKWERGKIPLPEDAAKLQSAINCPKIKFWACYFNSLIVHFDIGLNLDLQAYEDQLKFVEHSRSLRTLLKHKSHPHDEVFLRFTNDLNPQGLNIQLQIESRFSEDGVTDRKDIKRLVKKYEIDQSVIERLIKDGEEPTFRELEQIISRTIPGYERERVLLGYFSLLIKKYNLGLFLGTKASEGYLQQLENLAKKL